MNELLAISIAVVFIGILYVRADYRQYSLFTVGSFKRVHRARSTAEVNCQASLCETTVTDGEVRKPFKELVVFGIVIIRFGGVENHYCQEHTSLEFQEGEVYGTSVERLQETLAQGFVSFLAYLNYSLDADLEDDDAFSKATSSTADAISLLPVAMIVLFAALIISIFSRFNTDIPGDNQ